MDSINKDLLDRFLHLCCEELSVSDIPKDPYGFLFNLWNTDREEFLRVFKGSLDYIKDFRGLEGCLCDVALAIRDESIRQIIEDHLLRKHGFINVDSDFAATAFLLGSKKIEDCFRDEFIKSFSCGLDSDKFSEYTTTWYLEITALLHLKTFESLIMQLLERRNEQFHRKAKSNRIKKMYGALSEKHELKSLVVFRV